MHITVNVNNPDVEAPELQLINLDVPPDMTLADLRSSIEAEGIPAPSQNIYHNGQLITDNSKTLRDLNISDGDMLALHVRDMRGNTGVAPAHRGQQSAQRRAGAGAGAAGGAGATPLPQDPETIRLQILGDPQLRRHVEQTRSDLAAVLEDPQRFAQMVRTRGDEEEAARLARMREIEALNNDEFNPESQAKIEDMIRQQGVMENLQNAMEYNPESFGRVHLLYVDVKVNGFKVKGLVDSGAQATIMSPACAEACNIMRLVDKRFAGVARGVGTANIIGRVHYTELQLGTKHLPAAFTVMEGKSVDLLIGLDILKGHQATIDLARNKLIIQGEEVDFLGESDIPKETEEAVNEEPTVQGPGGTTIGARSGAVTAPTGRPAPAASAAGPSAPRPIAPPARPSQPQPQAQPRRAFPEEDIQKLVDLGWNRQAAISALEASGGDIDIAASILFNN